MSKAFQLDVMMVMSEHVKCSMRAGDRWVTVFMHRNEYHNLVDDGFFVRDGKTQDSAGVINTTDTYYYKKPPPEV
jgi:hypothetical protein